MSAAAVQTHSSIVLFAGDRVYKLKRPIDLGFSDFRTREARLAGCQAEVRLNRRLSPDVYLGVSDVLGPGGRLCDHLVVMRRLPDERRLAGLVRAGRDVTGVLAEVAAQLAGLHRRSPVSGTANDLARAPALAQLWNQGLDAVAGFPDLVSEGVRETTRELALRWLAGRGPLLDARVAAGRVRDGHGDLLADDIFVLDDGPRVLDCLEFDERLRIGDGLADASFLAMDLERLGAPAAARRFLDAYERASGDDPPRSLEDLYVAYRAQVRCKVSCIRARQQPGPEVEALARDHADLALRRLQHGRVRLVLVGGLPGSGKSTLAERLAAETGWLHLSSDLLRKQLAGVPAGEHRQHGFRTGLYSPDSTARTYGELLTRAQAALETGGSVLLDASFTDGQWREQARELAQRTSSDLVELHCAAPPELADHRIRERTGSASDATPGVRRQLARSADAWPEAASVDTTRPLEASLAQVRHLVGAAPEP